MLQRMLNRLRGANDDEKGFTLIELLVVILIIGILAAIALPTFLGQREKANDASAKSDVRNAVTQVESCLVDEATTPTNCQASPQVSVGSTVTNGGGIAITGSNDYTVTAKSEGSNHNFFVITKTAAGTFARSCGAGSVGGAKGKGSCPTSGSW